MNRKIALRLYAITVVLICALFVGCNSDNDNNNSGSAVIGAGGQPIQRDRSLKISLQPEQVCQYVEAAGKVHPAPNGAPQEPLGVLPLAGIAQEFLRILLAKNWMAVLALAEPLVNGQAIIAPSKISQQLKLEHQQKLVVGKEPEQFLGTVERHLWIVVVSAD